MNGEPTNEEGATDAASVPSSGRIARLAAKKRRRRITLSVAAAAIAVAFALGAVAVSTTGSSTDFAAELNATAAAPSAYAAAAITRDEAGYRVVLDVRGLPTLSAGRFYQVWLANSTGTLVPIGTFSSHGRVTLWSGVSPRDFRGMSVTIEAVDDEQASSGQRVLFGEVHAS